MKGLQDRKTQLLKEKGNKNKLILNDVEILQRRGNRHVGQ